jgi:hypothetical protein
MHGLYTREQAKQSKKRHHSLYILSPRQYDEAASQKEDSQDHYREVHVF